MVTWDKIINSLVDWPGYMSLEYTLGSINTKGLIWQLFTGIIDKKGKEIYEDDIVVRKIKRWKNGVEEDIIGVVKYRVCEFVVMTGGKMWETLAIKSSTDWEVIGNIHESSIYFDKPIEEYGED